MIQVPPGCWHFLESPCSFHHMFCPHCRVADAVEHYLDFLALLQEGPQQQVGVVVKTSLGGLVDEVWIPIARPGPRCHPWTPGFSVYLDVKETRRGVGTPDLCHVCLRIHTRDTWHCCSEKQLPLPCGEQLSAWFWMSFTSKVGICNLDSAELLVLHSFCTLQQASMFVGAGLSFAGQQLWVPSKHGVILLGWVLCSSASCAATALAPQVPLDGDSPLPRIPEVFLEAASALEQAGGHHDAITLCEEVISRTTDLIPRMLRVEERLQQPECLLPGTGLSQQKESLCCLAWRAAGYLHQGWAWATLGESKEAIMQFSRCLGDLLRVQICGTAGRTLHSAGPGRDLCAWQCRDRNKMLGPASPLAPLVPAC